MEMMWPVLAVMVPLFVGGVIVLVMYWRRDPVGTDETGDDPGGLSGSRPSTMRRRSLSLTPRTMAIGFAGLAVAVVLALAVGFPLVRTLLMAVHAPIEPG